MLHEIKVPETGFGIAEATIVEWFKRIGEEVQEGELIVSVETEKVNVEIPAPGSGILSEIRFQVGDVIPVGEVLGIITSEVKAVVVDQVKPRRDLGESDQPGSEKLIPQAGKMVMGAVGAPLAAGMAGYQALDIITTAATGKTLQETGQAAEQTKEELRQQGMSEYQLRRLARTGR